MQYNTNCSISFENELGVSKKKLRSGNKPLAQLCRRMAEEESIKEKVKIPVLVTILRSKKEQGKIVITRLKFMDAELSVKKPNNIVLLKNGKIIKIERIICEQTDAEKEYFIEGTEFSKISPAFLYPEGAFKELNMFSIQLANNNVKKEIFPISEIKSKIVFLNIYDLPGEDEKLYSVPLLHM